MSACVPFRIRVYVFLTLKRLCWGVSLQPLPPFAVELVKETECVWMYLYINKMLDISLSRAYRWLGYIDVSGEFPPALFGCPKRACPSRRTLAALSHCHHFVGDGILHAGMSFGLQCAVPSTYVP